MDIFYHNFSWMGFNLCLAFLGMLFGWLFYISRSKLFSIIFFVLWFLFIPNTIYLITDLEHLYDQWGVTTLVPTLLILLQYVIISVIGIVSFIMSMHPVDKIFTKFHFKKHPTMKLMMLVTVNMLIAFALILGKYERTHSWYVFTQTSRVIDDIRSVLTSPLLFLLVIFFGIVINLVYFAFKKIVPIDAPKR